MLGEASAGGAAFVGAWGVNGLRVSSILGSGTRGVFCRSQGLLFLDAASTLCMRGGTHPIKPALLLLTGTAAAPWLSSAADADMAGATVPDRSCGCP